MHTESSSFHLVVSRNELSILLLPCTTEAYPFVTLCHKQMSCCHGVPQLSCCHLVPQIVVLLPLCATNSCLVATSCHEQLSCCHFGPQTVVLLPPCARLSCCRFVPRTVILLPPDATLNELSCYHLVPRRTRYVVELWRTSYTSYARRVVLFPIHSYD